MNPALGRAEVGKVVPKLGITPWNGTSKVLLPLLAKGAPGKSKNGGKNEENPSGGPRGGNGWDSVVSKGPRGSQPEAPLGISAVWEGIVMSHPPAKVPAGRKGGAQQGDFQTWQCLFGIRAEGEILRDPEGRLAGDETCWLLDITRNPWEKKTWDCCKAQSTQGQKYFRQCFPSP